MLKVILFFIFIFFAAIFSIWLTEDTSYMIINWLGYEVTATTPVIVLIVIFYNLIIYQVIRFLLFIKNLSGSIKTNKKIKNYRRVIENLNLVTANLITNNNQDTEKLILKSRKLLKLKDRKYLSTVESFLLYKNGKLEQAIKKLAKSTNTLKAREFFVTRILENIDSKTDESKIIELAENLISTNSKQSLPYIKLFKIYIKNNFYAKAEEVLTKAIKNKALSNKDSETKKYLIIINTLLSKESIKDKDIDGALGYINKALKIDKNFIPALFYKMKCLYLKGNFIKLKFLMSSSWKNIPNISFVSVYKKIFDAKNSKERFDAIKKLYRKNPKNELSNILLLKGAIDNNKIKEARVLINETMKEYTSKTMYAIIEVLNEYEKGDIYKTKKFLEENYKEYNINSDWTFNYSENLELTELFNWES